NCSSSSLSLNKGLNLRISDSIGPVDFNTLFFNSSKLIGFSSIEETAAPIATNNWELSGKIISSSFNPKVSIYLFLSSGKKCKGPPEKATFPFIGLPQAKLDIV